MDFHADTMDKYFFYSTMHSNLQILPYYLVSTSETFPIILKLMTVHYLKREPSFIYLWVQQIFQFCFVDFNAQLAI